MTTTISLYQHSDQINQALGKNVAYATTVMARYDVAAMIKALQTARRPLTQLLATRLNRDPEAAALGERMITLPDGTAVLYRRQREGQRERRIAPAEVVKRRYPKLYEASKTLVNYRRVTAPRGYLPTMELPHPIPRPLHPDTQAAMSTEAVAALTRLPVFDTLTALHQQLVHLDQQLENIAAQTNWDGQRIRYTDGWAVELRRVQYSSDKLAEIAPEVFDQLAEVRHYRSGGNWYPVPREAVGMAMTTGHIDTGAVDLDAD